MHPTVAIVHNIPIHYKHLLFCALQQQGLSFEVLFLAKGSQCRREPIPLSQDLYRHEVGFDGSYEAAPDAGKMRFVWQGLNRIDPEVVVIGGYNAVECWTAWLWGALHRRPRIMWFESNLFDYQRRPWRELPKRVFLRGCRAAHVYGRTNRAYLIRLGMPPERIFVKRAVVDVRRFSTPDVAKPISPSDPRTLLYVGRFAPEKNLSFVLEALAKLPQDRGKPRLRLALVGYGPEESRLRAQVTALRLESLVDFKGPALQSELPAIYRQADFFILPSTREPWGLVALEAMLCRLPVLISTQCGCCEDLINPGTGWLFSPWDAGQLATLLETICGLPSAEIARMGEAGWNLGQLYSPENSAERIIDSIMHVDYQKRDTHTPISSELATTNRTR